MPLQTNLVIPYDFHHFHTSSFFFVYMNFPDLLPSNSMQLKSWKSCEKTRNIVWNIHLQKLFKKYNLYLLNTHTNLHPKHPPLIKGNFDTYFVTTSSLLNFPPQIPLSNRISSPTFHWLTQTQPKFTTFSRH